MGRHMLVRAVVQVGPSHRKSWRRKAGGRGEGNHEERETQNSVQEASFLVHDKRNDVKPTEREPSAAVIVAERHREVRLSEVRRKDAGHSLRGTTGWAVSLERWDAGLNPWPGAVG